MGGSRRMACPVTLETLSIVPLTGARADWVIRPNMVFTLAKTSSFSMGVPSGLSSETSTSCGSTPSTLARLIGTTLPGSSVRATTVPAVTRCPRSTSTRPRSGSRRSRSKVMKSVTRRPGMYACAMRLLCGLSGDGRRRGGRGINVERLVPTREACDALGGRRGQREGAAAAAVEDQPDHAALDVDLARLAFPEAHV